MPRFVWMTVLAVLSACASAPPPPPVVPVKPAPPPPPDLALPQETHLHPLTQLTAEGENAEAYWRFDGNGVSLQRRSGDVACDRIYTLDLFDQNGLIREPQLKQVSSGKGATTCSHFFPDNRQLLYASTHLAGEACPPKPDMSKGYVWAIYDSYDIFKANADGSGVTQLTNTPGYDAEGTVCGKDGSVIFTSVRDGDIELYRMDKDGKNVKRLTFEPGYDGGAFFNADCSKIVWRASRPKPGPELAEFKALLNQGLVRPTKLEIYVANADGSEPRQVTYLNAASFAPFWYPKRDRLIFSSNYGDPRGREFDLWAINADGTELERITHTPGFDGFPMFSPDGQWLLFSSNRATKPDQNDTNLFIARWDDHPPRVSEPGAAERTKADVTWLADPAREGRGIGTTGLAVAGAYIEQRFKALGLEPAGEAGTYRASFQVTTALTSGDATWLKVDGKPVQIDQYVPLGFSARAPAVGPAVLAGYGMLRKELGLDDFKGLDVKDKIVVARRFAPEHEKLSTPEALRQAGDLRKKAFVARTLGAKGLIVVDWPEPPKPAPSPAKVAAAPSGGSVLASPAAPSGGSVLTAPPPEPAPAAPAAATTSGVAATAARDAAVLAAHSGPNPGAELPAEAALPELRPEGSGDAGIPVMIVKRAALEPIWAKLQAKKNVEIAFSVALQTQQQSAFNVVGRVSAPRKLGGAVIIGAHYDHLGLGGRDSLAPDKHEPHLGADDNASGTASVLEIARSLMAHREELTHDVILAAFSAEESGVLGSSALVASKPSWLNGAVAMLNLDMVGRLRGNQLNVLGSETAPEWGELIQTACERARVQCKASGDGYGPSDHMAFYTAGLPVLHFFTGAHSDYHKPSDRAELVNGAGMAHVSEVVVNVALGLQMQPLTYQKVAAHPAGGDARSFNASLGTVPDYGGPPPGTQGVLLADVRAGGGAEQAGMRRGDILIKLGKYDVRSVEDLMFVLMQAKPGETVTAVVLRDGAKVPLEATFQEGRRR